MARHSKLTAQRRLAGLASAFLALATATGSAAAADLPPVAGQAAPADAEPAWTFQATFYGWLTAVDGDIGVRNLPDVPVNASIAEVLENLDGALMGTFFASNGQWMFLADLVLARLGHDSSVGSYGLSSLDAGLSQTVATGAVGYWLPLGAPNVDVAATAGLRYVQLSTDISLTPGGLPLSLAASYSEEWIDPTVGLVAQWTIDEHWFVNAVVDVGGFGVGSKLSSSGYLGVGYMWTPSISTAVGYRYLYEDYEDASAAGTFRYNTTMHGPTVSLAWHF